MEYKNRRVSILILSIIIYILIIFFKKRCIAICAGHTESVGAVAMACRNTDFVCSGSQDKTLKVWNTSKAIKEYEETEETAQCTTLGTIKAHDMEINTVAISPNDQIIATGARDKLVKLWNKNNLSLMAVLRGHKRGVWCVKFSPIDRCIASSSADKTIKIWSLSDYSCLRTFEGHTGSVLKFSFVTKGMQLLSSGSDGLVKLWTIKTNECVNTFEHHDDKVWALTTMDDGNTFATGDGDCIMRFWKDITETEKEKVALEREETLLQEQELSNLLHDKDYRKAIHIAFKLDQPFKIHSIFSTLYENEPESLNEIVSEFNDDSLRKCLLYIRDWNTRAKTSIIAQEVLNQILRKYSPSKLMKIEDMKVLLQGLIPYTDRHFQRVDLLLQKACIIDFTLERMNILTPIEEIEDINESSENTVMDIEKEIENDDAMESESSEEVLEEQVETSPEPASKRRKVSVSKETPITIKSNPPKTSRARKILAMKQKLSQKQKRSSVSNQ